MDVVRGYLLGVTPSCLRLSSDMESREGLWEKTFATLRLCVIELPDRRRVSSCWEP